MTANPAKPIARYRPGKPAAPEHDSSEEEDSDDKETAETHQLPSKPSAPTPSASSFPKDSSRIAQNLKSVDLNARRAEAARAEKERQEALAKDEEGFVTEEESEEGSDASGSESEEEDSEEEESSSEDEATKRRKMMRPMFVRKDQRKSISTVAAEPTEDEKWAEEERRRKEKADALVQEQLDARKAEKEAGKKAWDDDEAVMDVDAVDDTDGVDPEAEYAAWKLRELRRIKREREVIEAAEAERAEIERRRNLTQEEREAEDREKIEEQKEAREGKGNMAYMQKYFHKGAFFQDDEVAEQLRQRDIMGSRFADQSSKDVLPEYLQIRDANKIGKKGRSRYRDMKSEDTGRWGEFGDRRPRGDGSGHGGGDRFRSDAEGPTGANAGALGERKRYGDEQAREGKRPRTNT